MKISDPLGKVYTHTMFNKRNRMKKYESNKTSAVMDNSAGEEYQHPHSSETCNKKNGSSSPTRRHHHHRRSKILEENEDSENEDDDDEETRSEDGSLSTKSSRIPSQSVRNSRRREYRSGGGRHLMRDLGPALHDEDGISYVSSTRTGINHQGSKRKPSVGLPYPPEGIGPPRTTYNLWSGGKIRHRHKFNRSLCGVLLGISIVLVVLGILGIIGIAVYLGVVQKGDLEDQDLISIDGAFRVTSSDFSISLLNPESDVYRQEAKKYAKMISNTFKKSALSDAFVKTNIEGFSSGSVRVFYKLYFNPEFLPAPISKTLIRSVKSIFLEEVVSFKDGEFGDLSIDFSSVAFTRSSSNKEKIQFFKPEPYLSDEPNLAEKEEEAFIRMRENASKSTLWQTLVNEKNKNNYYPSSSHPPPLPPSSPPPPPSPVEAFTAPTDYSTDTPRRKLVLPPNAHPIELLTGVRLDPTLKDGKQQNFINFPHDQMNPFLRVPNERASYQYDNHYSQLDRFPPNAIPFNAEPQALGAYYENRRRNGDFENNNEDNEYLSSSQNTFWSSFNQKPVGEFTSPKSNLNDEDKFNQLLKNKFVNQLSSVPVAVSTTPTNVQDLNSVTPKIQFKGSSPSAQAPLSRLDEVNASIPISIFNPGTSGLQVIDKAIPVEKKEDQISIGGSLKVDGSKFPRFVHADSKLAVLPTGKPMIQGPNGPVIVTPHGRPIMSKSKTTPIPIRTGMNTKPSKVSTPHSTPGPGNYYPPVNKTPHKLKGNPGSGQQLIKNYLKLQRDKNEQMKKQQEQISIPQGEPLRIHKNLPHPTSYSLIDNPVFRPSVTQRPPLIDHHRTTRSHRKNFPPPPTSSTRRKPSSNRRQDLSGVPPSVGVLSSGLTPLGIFSNLLNVYATIDSKHDITGKILDSASAIFGNSPSSTSRPLSPEFSPSMKETSTTGAVSITRIYTTSTTTTTTTTPASIRVFPPVKSNVNPNLPLRPKPPSEDLENIPARPYGIYGPQNSFQFQNEQYVYGMNNPLYFSRDSTTPQPAYGPKDFIVETVTLDRSILNNFFTSKPTLLSNQSTRIRIDPNLKRSSRVSAEKGPPARVSGEFGQNFLQKLKEMVQSQGVESTTSLTSQTTTTATPRTLYVTSEIPKFKRYHIPPEIKITRDYTRIQ